jgi:hypothetical protein
VVADADTHAGRIPRERVAELVGSAAYGSVLVLAALSVVGVSDVALGHGSELVTGVGVATWIAHLFAELLGSHVNRPEPLRRKDVASAAVDGSPILVTTVLPAFVLLLGRVEVLSHGTARIAAILVAMAQLLAVGAYVGRVTPNRPAANWAFAAVSTAIGIAVVAATVLLGH